MLKATIGYGNIPRAHRQGFSLAAALPAIVPAPLRMETRPAGSYRPGNSGGRHRARRQEGRTGSSTPSPPPGLPLAAHAGSQRQRRRDRL